MRGLRARSCLAGLTLMVALATHASSSDLGKAEVVGRFNNWKVLRTLDNMTDKVSCVAVYRDQYRIQLSPGVLYISYRAKGGVQGYRVRFDAAPPEPYQTPDEIERRMSTIAIRDAKRLLSAQRLRVSGISYLQTSIDEDLALEGIAAAHAALSSGRCASSGSGWDAKVRR